MSQSKIDFLRFSANSIKEYITQKLTENSKFTDQVYEGSNLAILIDIVSYMYQCMVFQLNNAAAESMWSDTYLYENISRLSKILGYSPKGILPSSGVFYIDNVDDNGNSGKYNEGGNDFTVPKYAYFDTKNTDKNGNTISYSIKENFTIKRSDQTVENIFYNGKWQKYHTVFTASGSEYESYILEDLVSDAENERFVADGCVDVYVQEPNSEDIKQWEKIDNELFINRNIDYGQNMQYGQIYDGEKEVFNLRLNENKQYEIKFGNGVVGKIPPEGSLIYIFYMVSNGESGKIDIDTLDAEGATLCHSQSDFGVNETIYRKLFNNIDPNALLEAQIKVQQNYPTSEFQQEESPSDIRNNAPIWFKTGARMVTVSDYEFFIKNILGSNNIIDCKVQNNWKYMQSFYAWLYNLGIKSDNNEFKYLNESNLIKYDYKYSDAADYNNIYVWLKTNNINLNNVQTLVNEKLSKLKTITSELVLLTPIDVNFAVTAAPIESILDYIVNDDTFDSRKESYIEITLNNNCIYSSTDIREKVNTIINEFFSLKNTKLGQIVNFSKINEQIYEISGIDRIRTIFKKKIFDGDNGGFIDDPNESTIIKEGISFASWSNTEIIDIGADLDSSNTSKTLEQFQFPVLYTKDIRDRIVIIKKSLNNINKVTY